MRKQFLFLMFFISGPVFSSSLTEDRGFLSDDTTSKYCFRHLVKYRSVKNECVIEIAADTSARVSFSLNKCLNSKLNNKWLNADFKVIRNPDGEEKAILLHWFEVQEKMTASLRAAENGMAFPIKCR